MKIAVCDDQKIFRKQVVDFLEKYYHSLDVLIDTCDSGEELMKKYESGSIYDILFLDIEMDELDGITTAKRLRAYGEKAFIVFLTSHTEFAMKGYEVEAVRFLTKPVREDKMLEALKEIERRIGERKTMLLHTKEQDIIVDVKNIVYIEAVRNDIFILVCDYRNGIDQGKKNFKEYQIRKRMMEVEDELEGKQFYRCHRSYMVNLDYVTSYSNSQVTIMSEITLPVSRGKGKALKERVISNVRSRGI